MIVLMKYIIILIFFPFQTKIIKMSSEDQSQGYSPEGEFEQQQAQNDVVYRKRTEKQTSNSIEGKWTEEQNLNYVLFMDAHLPIFSSKEKRKSARIFKSLSDFLETRTPRQCRSHFQKIMNKFKKIRKVLQHYQQQLGPTQYHEKLTRLSEAIKGKKVKQEQTVAHCSSLTIAVQTEPFQVSLADLSGSDVFRLMNLLSQFQKSQLPYWMPNNAYQSAFTAVDNRKYPQRMKRQ